MAKEYTTGVVLVNWNGCKDTIECLESLVNCIGNFCVVVVDNCSEDDSIRHIKMWACQKIDYQIRNEFEEKRHDKWLTIISASENRGFASGCNIGIKYLMSNSKIKFIWLLNNDTVVLKDTLKNLIEKMNSDTRYGICGSTLLYYNLPNVVQTLGGFKYNRWTGIGKQINNRMKFNKNIIDEQNIEKMLYGINGASMFIDRKVIDEVGLLNEEYFLYYEEQDLSARIGEKYKIGYAKNSIVLHKEGQSIGGNSYLATSSSKKSDFYLIRSRIKFTKKFFPLCIPTVCIGLFVTIFNRIRRKQFDRIPMIVKIGIMSLVKDNYKTMP